MHTKPYDGAFNDPYDMGDNRPNNGLTKREYFAVMAMQGALAGAKVQLWLEGEVSMGSIAEAAVEQADELIDALNKERP